MCCCIKRIFKCDKPITPPPTRRPSVSLARVDEKIAEVSVVMVKVKGVDGRLVKI